ncbi:MAG: hypothetical protein AB1698_20935 [Pseudomonadota bacterium]
MEIIARKIDLIGNMPHAGDREGGATFTVTFEVRGLTKDLELEFTVKTKDGVDDALQLARKELVNFATNLRDEALRSDLGHGPRRLY